MWHDTALLGTLLLACVAPQHAQQPWDIGVGGAPNSESNFEIKLGQFRYLSPLDMLAPYGPLAGHASMVRRADGKTSVTMALWIRETALFPPQTEVTSQLFRGTCTEIELGMNYQYQEPYLCPFDNGTGTLGCNAQQVASWPDPLEVNLQGNLDSMGRVISSTLWNVHVPASDSTAPFSLVTFDPSFPPGFFKMGCADLEADRIAVGDEYFFNHNLVVGNNAGNANVKIRLQRSELGTTVLRMRLDNFGASGSYKAVVRSIPCRAAEDPMPSYFVNESCNLFGNENEPSCNEANDGNLMTSVQIMPTDGNETVVEFNSIARADASSIEIFACTPIPDGSCTIQPGAVTCLDLSGEEIFADTTVPTTPSTSTSTVTSDSSSTSTLSTSTTSTVATSTEGTTLPATTLPATTLPATTLPATTDDAQNRQSDGDAGGDIGTEDGLSAGCGSTMEPYGSLCCLPATVPSSINSEQSYMSSMVDAAVREAATMDTTDTVMSSAGMGHTEEFNGATTYQESDSYSALTIAVGIFLIAGLIVVQRRYHLRQNSDDAFKPHSKGAFGTFDEIPSGLRKEVTKSSSYSPVRVASQAESSAGRLVLSSLDQSPGNLVMGELTDFSRESSKEKTAASKLVFDALDKFW